MASYALVVGLIMLIGMVVLMTFGVPVSISLGLPAAISIAYILGADKAALTSAQRTFTGVDSFPLLAIPLFVLAGVIMNNGGIAARLVDMAKVLVGRLPGSLAHTNVVANMMFGSISGSALAGAAAVGSTMAPIQKREKYDPGFASAANVASAPSGMLIPPSNTLIVYSLVSQASVGALFLAGYIPGILWGLTCMVMIWWYCRGKPELRSTGKITAKIFFSTFLRALPSLLLVLIVIGGIVGGFFTATEGSAVAVLYALVLSFIYRTIKVSDLYQILLNATRTSSVVIFLIGVSSIMSWIMAFTKIPQLIATGLFGWTDNKVIVLVLMMLVLLIIGIPLDATPAVLIFTPIFLPIAVSYGIHPVHFGIMLVFNMCLAVISPPSAPVLFVGAKVAGLTVEQVIRPLIPFFVALCVMLLIIAFVPALSMWLPTVAGLVGP